MCIAQVESVKAHRKPHDRLIIRVQQVEQNLIKDSRLRVEINSRSNFELQLDSQH